VHWSQGAGFIRLQTMYFLTSLLDVHRWKPAGLHSVLAADRQNDPAGGAADEGWQPRRGTT